MDLTGQRFGRYVVIKEAYRDKHNGRYWWCECDCGNVKRVNMNALRGGKVVSCGCAKTEKLVQRNTLDVTEKKFGKLTAIKPVGKNDNKHVTIWECQCDCGNAANVRVDLLRNGDVKSCGCLKLDVDRKNLIAKREDYKVDDVFVPKLTQKMRSDNTSGYKGVYWSKRDKRWIVRIALKGKVYHIGTFTEWSAAVAARKDAEGIYYLPYVEALEKIRKIKEEHKK